MSGHHQRYMYIIAHPYNVVLVKLSFSSFRAGENLDPWKYLNFIMTRHVVLLWINLVNFIFFYNCFCIAICLMKHFCRIFKTCYFRQLSCNWDQPFNFLVRWLYFFFSPKLPNGIIGIQVGIYNWPFTMKHATCLCSVLKPL
jgi:hypothetical protein